MEPLFYLFFISPFDLMLYKDFSFYKRIKKSYLTSNQVPDFDARTVFFLPQTIFLPNTNKRSSNGRGEKKVIKTVFYTFIKVFELIV